MWHYRAVPGEQSREFPLSTMGGQQKKAGTDGSAAKPDEPEFAFRDKDFDEMAKVGTSSAYERKHKPFAAPTERIPTIGEQWAYASKRYSKYQGYAWSGALCVGLVAYLASSLTASPAPDAKAAKR